MSERAAPEELLRLAGITKSFPGVRALHEVTLTVRAGEVHALVGENGAGKSTLLAIAAGSLAPDAGSVHIAGAPLDAASPARARDLGLAIARQDPALLPDLTVAENMWLGVRPAGQRIGTAARWAAGLLAPWQMGIDPRLRVRELTVARRYVVEIGTALAQQPRVLLLDEPTEHLDAAESERLFAAIRRVAAAGTAVVYISHRIPEVRRIADRVTVLRDGEVRGTFAVGDVDEDKIVTLIVGRRLDVVFPAKPGVGGGRPVLQADGLTGGGFTGVDLRVLAGEVVGLAGVQGNGQQEVLRALAGLVPATGRLAVGGTPVRLGSSPAARRAGVGYLPADRHGEGLLLPLSVRENVAIGTLDDFATAGVVRDRELASAVARQTTMLAVRTPSAEQPVSTLSGGNQQKVVLARAMLTEPTVLLADEPSQGVDAGARVEIYRIVRAAAAQGSAVVVVSSDTLELAGLCDRVLIFSRGQVVRELAGAEVTERAITAAALTATTHRAGSGRSGPPALSWRERARRFAVGDYAPAVALALVTAALGGYVAARNPAYLSARNLTGLLLLLTALAAISLGQLVVLLAGGIDLSVGPLSGFLVVVASYSVVEGAATGRLLLGVGSVLLTAALVGGLNGVLVQYVRINPVVTTLAMYMALRGLALTFRGTPAGLIDGRVTAAVERTVGLVPVAFILVVALTVGLEVALRRTRWGLVLRAVGSRRDAAARLGVRVGLVQVGAYLLCSLLVLLGGVMLMAQIGIGDPNSGADYTLSSITAVVLGGASIFGGRGSFVGALLGATLIQQVVNVSTFLRLSAAWQYWLLALLTVGAAAAYSRARAAGEAP